MSLKSVNLCYYEDDFLEDKCIWAAKLSNGQTVFQDDDRPGVDCRIAWFRLRNYVYTTDTDIVELYIKFRDHWELAGRSIEGDGFFFTNCVVALLSSFSKQFNCCITGLVQKSNIYCTRWKLPEIINIESFVKEKKDNIDKIIWNKHARKSNGQVALPIKVFS